MAAIGKRIVDALKPGQYVWSGGFGVKATDAGAKVYMLSYRIGRRKRRYTIGKHGAPWTPDSAWKEAQRLMGLIASGVDPLAQKMAARDAATVRELAERFLKEHVSKKKPRTQVEYGRLVNRIILPALGTAAVKAVTPSDVSTLHHRLRRTPVIANRAIAVLSKMLSLGRRWGLREGPNPCSGHERFEERPRRRRLNDVEIMRLGRALNDAERDVTVSIYAIAAIRLLILTGARKSEILSLRWEHVALEDAELRLPDSKTGYKIVHLPPAAVEVLRALPRIEDNPHVIAGRLEGAALVNLSEPWGVIRKEARLDDVTLHDLRRTHASVAINSGLTLAVVGGLLGHRVPATTARYAYLADPTLKQAAELVGTRIAAAMAQKRR